MNERKTINTWAGVGLILLAALGAGFFTLAKIEENAKISGLNKTQLLIDATKTANSLVVAEFEKIFSKPYRPQVPPPPPDMKKMKAKGCVTDGLFNGYGKDTDRTIDFVNESDCYYLHRSIETWLEAPDFDDIAEEVAKIERQPVVLGMFIAEAIDTKEKYDYLAENRRFDFDKMCREGTRNDWGEHTCKPSFARSEYRKYVRQITEQAMDLGVQSFLFGQIFYQDSLSSPVIPEIIREMKEYAQFKGMEILIGAQTNDIDDENYLRNFDYIEGGVGLKSDGSVENGPCFSRWDNWCWALLWNERFSSKAKNVLVHFDWSGKIGDDMSVFTRMDRGKRVEVMSALHEKFMAQDVGFLLPVLAVVPKDNGGCHGKSKNFYTPHDKYSCKDEQAIKKILE